VSVFIALLLLRPPVLGAKSVYLRYTEMLFPANAQENYMFLEVHDF
jgi:hypothetical protein